MDPFVKKPSRRPQHLRSKRPLDDNEDDHLDKKNKDEVPVKITRRVGKGEEDDDTTDDKGTTGNLENLSDLLYSRSSGLTESLKLAKEMAVAKAEYDPEQDNQTVMAKLEATRANTSGVDTVYRGRSAYRSFIDIKDTAKANAGSQKSRIAGPVRSSHANIRTTCRFDYAPDLCKDYNETGFCGFGDSCKFIHDRGDYKSGWELEQEWEAAQLSRQAELDSPAPSQGLAEETSEIPEMCGACQLPLTKPILMTVCKHYFCEKCALKHAAKSSKCPLCPTTINGQFTVYKPPKNSKS